MARKTSVKVPKRLMGAKIPKDIRKNLKRLLRSIEAHKVTSLVAMAVSTWLMSKLGSSAPLKNYGHASAR